MKLEKILKGSVMGVQRECLEKIAGLIAAGKNGISGTHLMREASGIGRQDSARQKILSEALDAGRNDPLVMQVGKHLFTQEDVQLQGKILLPGKHLEECIRYIMKCAEKKARGEHKNALYVPPDMVFGWAEDYYRADVVNSSDLYPALSGKGGMTAEAPGAGRQIVTKTHTVSGRKTGKRKSLQTGRDGTEKITAQKETPAGKQTEEKDGQMSLFNMP